MCQRRASSQRVSSVHDTQAVFYECFVPLEDELHFCDNQLSPHERTRGTTVHARSNGTCHGISDSSRATSSRVCSCRPAADAAPAARDDSSTTARLRNSAWHDAAGPTSTARNATPGATRNG